jgi:hypothetical protein
VWGGVDFMGSRPYLEIVSVEIGRVGVADGSGSMMGAMDRLVYEVLDTSVTNVVYVSDLLRAYREGGAPQVLRVVEDTVVSLLRGVYEAVGVEFDGEVGFSRLVDLGLIDEDTAVYLIATYMGIEQAVEEIEELEELGERAEVEETLKEITSKLQEIIHILSHLETPKPRYGSDRLYYATDYTSTGITYMVSVRGSS